MCIIQGFLKYLLFVHSEGVLSTYLAVSVTCFAIMGDAIESSNILNLMRSGWVVNTALVLISGHMAMSVIMSVNVINQDMDKLLQMDDSKYFDES